jgi:hypothetical protein
MRHCRQALRCRSAPREVDGVKAVQLPRTEGKSQIRQPPEGLQAESLNPPDPVGIPFGRTQPTDISF